MTTILLIATLFLAYANGANDNFKGVASLYGSGTAGYRVSLIWATLATLMGSVVAIFWAQELLRKFSGKGLVPETLTVSPVFMLSVALGAGLTVILATRLAFPISTTHGLTGAILGSGLMAVGNDVHWSVLGKNFVLPLLLSPFLAILLGAGCYLVLRGIRLALGIPKELCLCASGVEERVALPQPDGLFRTQILPASGLIVGSTEACRQQYAGRLMGFEIQKAVDAVHFLSAGLVCFARGLNDTPKIAALLLVLPLLDSKWGMVGLAFTMALGGWVHSRRIAETMSHGITEMNHGQGLSANLATAALVIGASKFGLPVSTTHVSVGSLFGIGLTTGRANVRVVAGIVLSWVLTLPCAAIIGALVYYTAHFLAGNPL